MPNQQATGIAAAIILLLLPGFASAFTVFDDFGSFPDATWGGSGIGTDAVAASDQFVYDYQSGGTDVVRVAMSATERYSNPPVSDNGAAIYTAGTGSNCGVDTDPIGCPGGGYQGALWNWNYYVDVAGTAGTTLGDYQIDIYYDLNPAGPNAFGDLSGLGKFDLTAFLLDNNAGGLTVAQDSQNNLFGWLATDDPPFVDAPGIAFDPNAVGNYQFAMTVTRSGFSVDTVAMEVNVVPIPAAVWLFGSALGLLGWMRRKTI